MVAKTIFLKFLNIFIGDVTPDHLLDRGPPWSLHGIQPGLPSGNCVLVHYQNGKKCHIVAAHLNFIFSGDYPHTMF